MSPSDSRRSLSWPWAARLLAAGLILSPLTARVAEMDAAAQSTTLADSAPQPTSDPAAEPAAPSPASSAAAARQGRLEVWVRAEFAETGALESLELADESGHPAAFVQEVKRQLAAARIRPPMDGDRPARLTTGIRLIYGLRSDDEQGRLRLREFTIRPLPVRRSAPLLPREIRQSRGWTGSIKGTCAIDEQGVCTEVAVEALPGMPESLRRWVRVTMSEWRFEPQRLNGKPMPGAFEHTFQIAVGDARPEDFRVPKFDRIEQMRR